MLPMMEWVNRLFSKQEAAGHAGPISAAGNVSLPPDLEEAIAKLGFNGFLTAEESGKPHLLQAETMKADNYLHCFCGLGDAGNILKAAYEESEEYPSPGPNYKWSRKFPDVEKFLKAQAPERQAAFEILFRRCKDYEKKVAETAPDSSNTIHITAATHAMSNAEAAEFGEALKKIWEAVPDTDPRVVEGMDYVLEAQPAFIKAFSGFWWTKNDRRSDYNIAAKLADPAASGMKPAEAAAIARQTADNLAALKPQAEAITQRILAWCLSRNVKIDDDWRVLSKSRMAATEILDALDHGSTPAEQGAKVSKGAFGPLNEESPLADAKKEELHKRALGMAAAAPDYIAFAQQLRTGAWFDEERTRLLALAEEAALTPEAREQRAREKKEKIVEQVAADATVLHNPVHVGNALRFKPRPAGR